MILYIDTTEDHKLKLAFYTIEGNRAHELVVQGDQGKSERLLENLDAFLSGFRSSKVCGIVVVAGPNGRFSAIRSGVVSANALGWSWNVPVIGIKNFEPVENVLSRFANLDRFEKSAYPVYPHTSPEYPAVLPASHYHKFLILRSP